MKYFLKRKSHVWTEWCRFCCQPETTDSSKHFISDCSYFDNWRFSIFKKQKIDLLTEEINSFDILKFISKDILKMRLLKWFNSVEEAQEAIDKNLTDSQLDDLWMEEFI
jgi:hypothetical protein